MEGLVVVLPKKRGPKKRSNMVSTHLFFPEPLLEWCKEQPEGFAGLLRQLAKAEWARRTEHVPTPDC